MLTKKVDAELGQKVDLTCEVLTTLTQGGCSWLFQNSSSKLPQPTFLVYVAASTGTVKLDNRLDSKLFSAKKDNKKYTLTLNKFGKENQGYYFCTIFINSVMIFSPLVPVFQKGSEAGAPFSWVLGVTSEHVSHTDSLLNLLGPLRGYFYIVPILQTRKLRQRCWVGLEVTYKRPGSGMESGCMCVICPCWLQDRVLVLTPALGWWRAADA